ncbi:asparagine synthase (glutamine-hydrolyzing) [Desulforhopalus sp. IMCC35007]|uniref:asparagine synthase (glutamine-hydrolyzing) n=1 Tax=Desulforhopalus sp. IMCC35007 TaxID=2569543 RepID=UPI0010AED66A|nr:asparagine synthase (glutamine-hydrolyzing) [Desulforhopalus sp. IMCC35007]TKB07421.1 asparagine synthase (glutamine-hydrolyzing) [Desulforhopalus sp. IMCC35007]
MCGIAGATRTLLGETPEEVLFQMNVAMIHRGPDMGDINYDDEIGLCHRRLSIIDLSQDGKQPMSILDGRFTIVFNGEIYNYLELRKGLQDLGYEFHSDTDTEVLLYLYAEYGSTSLLMIRGMFAYVIWDKKEKRLFGARDRIGKKPFFYYQRKNDFAFASELKSLLAIKSIPRKIDNTAFLDYLHYLFIPDPKTIYQNIYKLEPGHFFIFQNNHLAIQQYWDVDFSNQIQGSVGEISEALLAEMREATSCRLISDVPLGAFLSGGIDSSGIVALMAEALTEPVTTCSIGFFDKTIDEATDARQFAEVMQTNHHEHYVRDEPAQIIKKLVYHFGEPFADSSMVPTYYVSKLAKKNVTVALTGDGGDESFAGYQKYSADMFENRVRSMLPNSLLALGARVTNGSDVGLLKRANSLLRSTSLSPGKAFFLTNSFITNRQLDLILSEKMLNLSAEYDPSKHIVRLYDKANGPDHLSKILYTDLKMYLPGDILVKVDRMSMANSLEVRSPLLDHKLIEFAASIPSDLKLKDGEKKFILKNSLKKVLPKAIRSRKKRGFVVPLDHWFRHELKEMAEKEIFHNNFLNEFLNLKSVENIWGEHQSAKVENGTLLWTILMFSLWLKNERDR